MKNYLFFLTLFLSVILWGQLTVSGTSTSADCPGNGTVTLNASGGVPPYEYRIVSGPGSGPYPTPYGSSNVFSSLVAGSYTFQVRDNIGTVASSPSIVVVNTYTPITFGTIQQTTTHTGSCASKQVTINTSGGKTPFTYELLSGGTTVYGPQSSNVFTNVDSGTYIARVIDACGEVRISTAFIVANVDYKWHTGMITSDNYLLDHNSSYPPEPFYVPGVKSVDRNIPYLLDDCETIVMRLQPLFSGTNMPSNLPRRVYIMDLTTNTIVVDETWAPALNTPMAGPSIQLKKDTPYRFYVDDLCNDVISFDRNYNYFVDDHWEISEVLGKEGCDDYFMLLSRPINWNYANRYATSEILNFKVLTSSIPGDPLVGQELTFNNLDQSQNNTDNNSLRFYGATPGATYSIEVNNGCNTYIITKKLGEASTFRGTVTKNDVACIENTGSLYIQFRDIPLGISGDMEWTINSGPTSFTSSNTGETHVITYPISGTVYANGISSPVGSGNIRNFPIGTYNITLTDVCGSTYTFDQTITEADVLKLDGYLSSQPECGGSDKIIFTPTLKQRLEGEFGRLVLEQFVGGEWVTVQSSYIGGQFGLGTGQLWNAMQPLTISTPGPGVYRVSIYGVIPPRSNDYKDGPLPANGLCEPIFQGEIEVFGYNTPVILPDSKGYVCTPGGNDGKVILHVANGVAPYEYQLLDAGNNVILTQSSATFTNLSEGVYRFRVLDSCGNGVVQDIEVKALENPRILTTGDFCPGGEASITSLPIADEADVEYLWTGPNGFTSTEATITFNPLEPIHYGTYTVTQTVLSCSVSFASEIIIDECSVSSNFPIAEDDEFTINQNSTLNDSVAGNDIPSIDNPNQWSLFTPNGGATNGTVILNLDGTFTYTPNPGFVGTDTFEYRVCDADGDCDFATVTIHVVFVPCFIPGATGGDVLATNVGITSFERVVGPNDPNGWPEILKGGWLVLESTSSGFVLNRIPTSEQVEEIPNPVIGMMVFDMEADCLKVYTTKDNGISYGWYCLTQTGCPE